MSYTLNTLYILFTLNYARLNTHASCKSLRHCNAIQYAIKHQGLQIEWILLMQGRGQERGQKGQNVRGRRIMKGQAEKPFFVCRCFTKATNCPRQWTFLFSIYDPIFFSSEYPFFWYVYQVLIAFNKFLKRSARLTNFTIVELYANKATTGKNAFLLCIFFLS